MLRRVPPLAAAFTATLIVTVAWGQGAKLKDIGTVELRKEWKQNEQMATDLLAGRVPADPKGEPKHLEALDAQAKWMTWRYFWLNESVKPREVLILFQQFDSDVFALKKGEPTTKEAERIYSEKIGEHALDVITEPTARQLAKLNAARVMARAADLGQPVLADWLIKVLKVPDLSEGARLYALRGLRELLAQDPPVLGKERLPAVVEALTEALDRKPGFDPKVTAPEEVDGFRYVRREAVRALAQVKDPSGGGRGKPALALLRVVDADGLTPEPRVDERLEAAIGLAHMRPADKNDKKYQPGYAVYHIGLMLDGFAAAVQQDRQTASAASAPKRLPWQSYAARLGDALRVLRDESKEDAYLTKVIPECLKVLKAIEDNAADVSAQPLLQFLNQNPPPSDRLIKGLESSTLKTK